MDPVEDLRSLRREITQANERYAELVERRNKLIIERYRSGRSAADLAIDSGLTEGRVHQILRKASTPTE